MNRIILVIVILLSVCTRSYSLDSLQVRRNYTNAIDKALKKIGEDMPYSAIDIMESLKDTSKLDNSGYNVLILAYNVVKKDNEAISLYKEWENNEALVKEATIREKMSMYSGVSIALSHVERFEESILMMEKYIDAIKEIGDKKGLVLAYAIMSETYENFGDANKALKYLNDAIRLKMDILDISITDILNERIYNEELANLFLSAARCIGRLKNYQEMQRYLTLSCVCGNENVIDLMKSYGLNYKKGLRSLKKEFKIEKHNFYEKAY